MSPLNIHPEEETSVPKKKKNKSLKIALGIAALVAIPVIGSTLAASISITNSPVEFGQGVVQTVSCDDEVTVTPNSVFVNATGAGSFNLDQVTISGIASTCATKLFAIKVYDDAGASPVVSCSGAEYQVAIVQSGSFCTEAMEYSYINDTLTVSFTPENILATDVYKITVETSDAA